MTLFFIFNVLASPEENELAIFVTYKFASIFLAKGLKDYKIITAIWLNYLDSRNLFYRKNPKLREIMCSTYRPRGVLMSAINFLTPIIGTLVGTKG